ncbi:MAG TPA: cytosine deaminase [Pseudomonas sp.]|uniref:Cytosine deaminase n=1 Tax=Stutzerimonas frequens TaxID=2968969 RepID=A0ABX6XVM2_9GAMM|nr:cytosine deaminase [Stutzerimonas frequens]MEC7475207.1 cytosine deaminase [Pseudomonadota bacterium]NCT78128.1 cytosine deaminase [Stutzerimonas stutzeri]HAW63066.1 cytosine deaminase [Pseudomonas sp.]KZX57293.1 cytosine deaminase [Stutzerimonas frequens]MBK3760268.1 cytosine deaminase [Stutzerimonas frequens]|tara:strand:- start:2608 stop:3843 length:1236 start_codon:yes stop_codon:yes gene_type:complete
MNILNARLRGRSGLYRIELDGARIAAISAQQAPAEASEGDIDAASNLVVPPFIEPHIHLDATLTAGEPAWNMSGTLFEGIERWGERKALVTHEDTKARAKKTIDMLVDHGIQHVRTHVDVTDPTLSALKSMLEVREETRHLIDLQIVAFPQEGIESFKGGRELMTEAIAMGADVVGGIPHFENTRDQGVSSIKFLMDLAERSGCLVDVHCDETDDPQSRFLEVLAEEARVREMGERVTASHTTAMGSYDNAYCSKLFRLLKLSQINFVSCPTESIHLQGRFDTYPKRRGLTRVAEIDRAGMNVCFGQDSIVDPWYPLGNGNILRILEAGLHICHMLGYEDLQRGLDLITDNSARTLNLGERYGLEVGRPASLLVLSAPDDYEMLRTQGHALLSVRNGEVLMRRTPAQIQRY